MDFGRQGDSNGYGLTERDTLDSLRCVVCFVVVCSALLLSATLIVSYCALMVLCSRWKYVRQNQLGAA